MKERDFSIPSPSGRPVRISATVLDFKEARPTILLCHGFCGFKAWGWFPELAKRFAELGFAAIRMDFSHNGMCGDSDVFDDLEGFEKNTWGKKLQDIGAVLATISKLPWVDPARLSLFGHSKGGGAVALFAAQNPELVSKVVTWNPVARCNRWSEEAMKTLETMGYVSYQNGRTNQELRVGKAYFDDLEAHAEERDPVLAALSMKAPLLVLQGANDTTVPPEESALLAEGKESHTLKTIAGGNHVFNCGHPFAEASREWLEAFWASVEFLRA